VAAWWMSPGTFQNALAAMASGFVEQKLARLDNRAMSQTRQKEAFSQHRAVASGWG
jgi:hypothetical protein